MKIENIERANQIKKELHALEYFTDNINSRWSNTKMIVKKKADISYSILGSRFFGCGTHEKEIPVPESLIIHVDAAVLDWKEQLEKELERL